MAVHEILRRLPQLLRLDEVVNAGPPRNIGTKAARLHDAALYAGAPARSRMLAHPVRGRCFSGEVKEREVEVDGDIAAVVVLQYALGSVEELPLVFPMPSKPTCMQGFS